jgi:hypothetical protein
VRDSGGSGNTVVFQTDQTVPWHGTVQLGDHGGGGDSDQPGAEQHQWGRGAGGATRSGTERRADEHADTHAHSHCDGIVERHDGAGRVNGNDRGCQRRQVDHHERRTAPWTPGSDPLPQATITASGTASDTVSASQVSVAATAGTHMVFIKGSGDIVSLSGGADAVTDTGSGNTYILPAAGNGSDTLTSDILTTGDTLDLKTALAAINWNRAASTLSGYLSVADSAKAPTLSISATSGGTGTMIATIGGATTASLTSLLAHTIA